MIGATCSRQKYYIDYWQANHYIIGRQARVA